jgi:hypothetical protein
MHTNDPMSCPRCGVSARPSNGPQRCGGCDRPFALYTGYAADPSVVPPPPDPRAHRIQVKSGLRVGTVEAVGVSEGVMDPVIGLVPVETSGVMFPDIVSIAVWREPDWVELAVAVLVPLPIGAFFAFVGIIVLIKTGFSGLTMAAIAVALLLLAAFMIRRALVTQKNIARVFGRHRCITVRFDRPGGQRVRFHDELLARAGQRPAAIP